MQFKKQDWEGIVQLCRQYYSIDLIIASLKSKLTSAVVDRTFTENLGAGKSIMEQALTSLSSEDCVEGVRNDIKIYIEATIARKRASQGPEVMLIS